MPGVLALYAGRAGTLATATGVVETAIAKSPVPGRVRAGTLGLPGDEQVFPSHGGPDRALCVYPREHYAHWSATVSPAFGENITSEGVLEDATVIGEVWRIGTALVQVTQPRSPCAKAAARLGIPDLVMRARRARFTGLHLRVLEPGEVGARSSSSAGPATASRSPTRWPRASTRHRIRGSSPRCSRCRSWPTSGASRPRRASPGPPRTRAPPAGSR